MTKTIQGGHFENDPLLKISMNTMRKEEDIFKELSELCRSPGYIYALCMVSFHESVIMFADGVTPEAFLKQYTGEHLIRAEISTLLGLMVQGDIDFTYPKKDMLGQYISKTYTLLHEIHCAILPPFPPPEVIDKMSSGEHNPFQSGEGIRETAFYAGESAYIFQYYDCGFLKYTKDNSWFIKNRGYSLENSIKILKSLDGIRSKKLEEYTNNPPKDEKKILNLLKYFTISINDIIEKTSLEQSEVVAVISDFALPRHNKNVDFTSIDSFNSVNAFPLFPVDDENFLMFHSYSVAASFYESPFYWMMEDKNYKLTAEDHRGIFTEEFCHGKLASVFGGANVHSNIELKLSKDRTREIDTLVVWGDRLVIVQAKSKKMTIEARKGNIEKIRGDFQKGFQDAYNQALSCAKLLLRGTQCKAFNSLGHKIKIPQTIKEVYLLCITSENYPGLSMQVEGFGDFEDSGIIKHPIIWDIFTLDVVAEFLKSPLYFLSYLNRRSHYADRIFAAHEITVFAHHLKNNLWLESNTDFLYIHDDATIELEIAFSSRRNEYDNLGFKTPTDTPEGILTRLRETTLSQYINNIDSTPEIIDLGFLLLQLSEDAFLDISKNIDTLAQLSLNDNRPHDVTAPLASSGLSSGLTIHVNNDSETKARTNLLRHARLRKYKHKAESWFGLWIAPDKTLRGVISLYGEWKYDASIEKEMQAVRMKTTQSNKTISSQNGGITKIGRNSPCPCGSGKKFKRCCML